jgi:geranylgeranyl transferase type-1 subunit beta
LELLDAFHLVDFVSNRSFLMDTQDPVVGGFSKWPDHTPDALHAYFGVCGLSLMNEPGLNKVHAAFNISQRAADHLARIHAMWQSVRQLPQSDFFYAKHADFLQSAVHDLLTHLTTADHSRIIDVYFGLSGLDLLYALNMTQSETHQIVDWICRLQVQTVEATHEVSLSSFQGCLSGTTIDQQTTISTIGGHLVTTVSALRILLVIGDDFSRVDRPAIIRGLKLCQLNDSGSISPCSDGIPVMKYIYCAVCMSYILQDFSGLDIKWLTSYIKSCLHREGGFGHASGTEANDAATFYAVASLILLPPLTLAQCEVESVCRWCVSQLHDACHKPDQAQKAFWAQAVLLMLRHHERDLYTTTRTLMLSTQCQDTGGFRACDSPSPDLLTTYYSLCGLALCSESGMSRANTALGISERAMRHLHELHALWLKQSMSSLKLD